MITLQNASGRPNCNYYEFFCDTIAEIGLLPTTLRGGLGNYAIHTIANMGSSCFCFEDKNIYLLSSSGWVII